ncbi:hypothetical protein GQ53DRAFT_184430 [Thozetella sp. PMI_491]|nr:hypothetical protein GQ53DRAFT_184430 [Thozetella sp. PMI_491]
MSNVHPQAAHETALDALLKCALSGSRDIQPIVESQDPSSPVQPTHDDEEWLRNNRRVRSVGGTKAEPYSRAFYGMAGLKKLFPGGPTETSTGNADTVESWPQSNTLSVRTDDPCSPLPQHHQPTFDGFYDNRGIFPSKYSEDVLVHQDNEEPPNHDWDKENRVPSSFSRVQGRPSVAIPYTLTLQFGPLTDRVDSSFIRRGTLNLNPHDLREEITLPLPDSAAVTFGWSLHLNR